MNGTEVRALTEEFLRGVRSAPKGDRIDQCLQCGTCSASCPTSHAMKYSPRAVVSGLRAGLLDRVLASNTVWLCASCYTCAVRCPAGIPFTDVMYRLKRMGLEKGLLRVEPRTAAMAKSFVQTVDRFGRNTEGELLRRYFLKTNPAAAIAQIPLGWRLLRRGRLSLRPRRLEGLAGLRKMLAAMGKGESR